VAGKWGYRGDKSRLDVTGLGKPDCGLPVSPSNIFALCRLNDQPSGITIQPFDMMRSG